MFVYIESEKGLYTVGHYSPAGTWEPESDWGTYGEAAARCHFLNGGNDPAVIQALDTLTDLCEEKGIYPVNVRDARRALSKAQKARK